MWKGFGEDVNFKDDCNASQSRYESLITGTDGNPFYDHDKDDACNNHHTGGSDVLSSNMLEGAISPHLSFLLGFVVLWVPIVATCTFLGLLSWCWTVYISVAFCFSSPDLNSLITVLLFWLTPWQFLYFLQSVVDMLSISAKHSCASTFYSSFYSVIMWTLSWRFHLSFWLLLCSVLVKWLSASPTSWSRNVVLQIIIIIRCD